MCGLGLCLPQAGAFKPMPDDQSHGIRESGLHYMLFDSRWASRRSGCQNEGRAGRGLVLVASPHVGGLGRGSGRVGRRRYQFRGTMGRTPDITAAARHAFGATSALQEYALPAAGAVYNYALQGAKSAGQHQCRWCQTRGNNPFIIAGTGPKIQLSNGKVLKSRRFLSASEYRFKKMPFQLSY